MEAPSPAAAAIGAVRARPAPVAAYEVDGSRVRATEHARGPWFPDQQHGAAVLALLARFCERVPSARPMRFTRITADLSRAVPMTELTVRATARRDGRRVQSVEAVLADGDEVLARAVATRIRAEPGLVPADRLPPLDPADLAPPFDGDLITYDMGYPSFHDCLEIRALDGDGHGNDRTWYRMAHPLVEGETPSPLVRVAAVADMIQSSAMRLGPAWISINPEVSVQIEREPDGDWLCTVSTVRFTDDGTGISSGVIFDRTRRVGASSKSVLNDRR